MDFTFSSEQDELRATVDKALGRHYDLDTRREISASEAGWSSAVWDRLVDLGLTAIPFPESAGGLDGSVVDLVAVAERLGAHLVVEPWTASVVLAGGLLTAAAQEPSRTSPDVPLAAWTEGVAAGSLRATLGHEEGRGTPDPELVTTVAERADGGHTLSGSKRLVLHGDQADLVLVTARLDESLALFAVEGPIAGARGYTTVDGRRAADLHLDATPALLVSAEADRFLAPTLDRALVVLAAEAVGAMGESLARTAEYVSTREQFGKPIGTFQAIAHRLADMKIAYTRARATLLYTTALAEAGRLTGRDVSVLKAQVGRLGKQVGESAIQAHGGVGMTDELSIGHLHKRILTIDAMFGGHDHHTRLLGV
ncbi:acyl-CoA dehydrogenase family protein [Brevibacterium litoralis]|uniref:acyl-CoA dehydrogenase family protein n=1 Tax=Brevibacterium litoralis TaxID=3138935 RepID=UPI0032EEC077